MEKRDIKIGQHYTMREPPKAGAPFQRVKVLDSVRSNKWRVEWVQPNAGLVDYVKSSNLIVGWPDRRAFLRDERQLGRLAELSADHWLGEDHPITRAVKYVLDSTGENIGTESRGVLSAVPDVFERIFHRANRDGEALLGDSVVDRHGLRHVTFDTARIIALAFARAEPETVVLNVNTTQRRDEEEARSLGGRSFVRLVEENRAAWALCRQWAGFDQLIVDERQRGDHYRRVAEEAIAEIRGLGACRRAIELDRRLHNV